MVSKNRISASYNMGGLQIPHPTTTITGLQQNIIQKVYKKEINGDKTTINYIIQTLLQEVARPSLEEHIHKLGPLQWKITATK